MKYFEKLNGKLHRLGIFRCVRDNKSKWIVIAKRCGLFIICTSFSISLAWFVVFEAQTAREHSESLMYLLASILFFSWYSAFLFQCDKYADLFDELNSVIEKKLIDPTVNLIYEKTKITIEWLTKYTYISFKIAAIVYILIPVILSIFNFFTSGFSNDSFMQGFPATYPFNWKTPLGYVVCICIQIPTMIVGAEIYASGIVLTIGFCMLIADFATDIKEKLRQFNQILIASEELTTDDRVILKKRLKKIIEFHSDARDFENRFSDVNSAIVSACPMYIIAVFGSFILQINILIETGDILGIIQITLAVLSSLFSFFLFCHFGGNITQQFEEIDDAAYQLEWYRLPLDMQEDIGIVIALAQKPIYMRGYGNTRSTYSVFQKILKNKFYFFMFTRRC